MKAGITFSTFDLFHAGHVKMLEEAKKRLKFKKIIFFFDWDKEVSEISSSK